MATSTHKLLFPNMMASANSRKSHSAAHPITICVEGNIGSGKTTLLSLLGRRSDVEIFQEPVHKWRNVRGKNLLDLMYSDPVRWSHLFQTYVQLTMMQVHLKPSAAKVKIMERSIHSARHCFVENLYQSGRMSDPEYNVYCEWYSTITSNLDIPVHLIVYLSASASLSLERIKERGRTEEANIPLSYLTELHELHRNWLYSDDLPAPLLVLSSDMTLEQMNKCVEERIDLLLLQQRSQTEVPLLQRPLNSNTFSGISPSNSPTKLCTSLLPASN
ncbi:Deoxynucleoside kinase domain [Trinorchestia longiramus]|nr:Deoxynucleoside kinase domain [Trinorchestia longiramus]